MRPYLFGFLIALVAAALFTGPAATQEEKKKKKDGPPGLLPPFVRDKLKLSKEQEQKVEMLHSTVQIRLGKILTAKQMEKLQEIMEQGPGGQGGKGQMPKGPKRAPGLIIPPFAESQLQLTVQQQRQLAVLERYTRIELGKILTPAQHRQLEEALRQGPGDRPGGKQGKEKMPPEAAPPPTPDAQAAAAGIQWFSTWESGLKEARRSGRPILLVAAAPHCGGVSGVW